ncbi:MAG: hypothetical protein QOF73_699 [Thermomicrobiales bacterium]|nr:hypothetical protein [Thermomicrobiales bacterium]
MLALQNPSTGRPAKDHRTILDGIVWHLGTGAPWRDLPDRFGPWQTLYSRLGRWQQAGGRMERLINLLKQHRAIATAIILIWLMALRTNR